MRHSAAVPADLYWPPVNSRHAKKLAFNFVGQAIALVTAVGHLRRMSDSY